jgi:hypothetical protein
MKDADEQRRRQEIEATEALQVDIRAGQATHAHPYP